MIEGDVIRTLRDNIQHIGHFHTVGNPGRNELNETQELYYRAICRVIAATDYDGYVGQKFTPKGDPLVGLHQAYDVCDVSHREIVWKCPGRSTMLRPGSDAAEVSLMVSHRIDHISVASARR